MMDELIEYLKTVGLSFSGSWRQKILAYHDLLIAANARCNLTRITELDDYLFKHVADALLIAAAYPAIREKELDIMDVGCGGGIPGLILAISFPRCTFVEVDSAGKKVNAVQKIIDDLELPNARARAGRARELARIDDQLGAYDLVIARAVGDAAALIRECRRLARPKSGRLILYKTPRQIENEAPETQREANKAGLAAKLSAVYTLPRDSGRRQFWLLGRDSANGQAT